MPIDTSFYNSAQPAQAIPGGIPGAVSLANALTENRLLNQNLLSRQAVGSAFQGAVDQDGNFDPGKAASSIANNPAAAYGAPEALSTVTGLRGQNLTQQGAGVAQSQARMADLYNSLNPLVSNGQKPTYGQVMSTAADLLHQGRLLPSDMPAIQSEAYQNRNDLGGFIKNKFQTTLPATTQAQPTVTGVDANTGQPIVQTGGQAYQKAAGSGYTTSLPVGQSESMATNVAELNKDYGRSSSTTAGLRNLTNVLPLIQQLGNSSFGPGSPEFAKIRGALTTAGIINPNTSDLQVRQEAGKYLLKYAQGAQNAGRSDQALSTAIGSNPNLDLTQPANLSLIKNQVAMDRMDAAVPLAFSQAHPDAASQGQYLKYKAGFNQQQDQRAYSFDLMAPDEQRSVLKSLGKTNSPAYQKFMNSLKIAHDAGLLTPQAPQ